MGLSFISGAVFLIVFISSWKSVIDESSQRVYWHIAQNLANKLQPALAESIDLPVVAQIVQTFSEEHPGFRVFLLRPDGSSYGINPGDAGYRVSSLEPIERFLASKRPAREFILGPMPVRENAEKEKERIGFSAARITIAGQPGYLYVLLRNQRVNANIHVLGNSMVLRRMTLAFLLIVGTTTLMALFIFSLVTKRFYQLADVIREFGKGNLKPRFATEDGDEIAQLGSSVNLMADTISANIDALKQKDDLRRELLANVSHDLRAPLAAIGGYAETILGQAEKVVAENHTEYLHGIMNNVHFLNNLVRELFDLSRLEAEEVQPKIEAFPIVEVTESLLSKYSSIANEKDISLQLNMAEDIAWVLGDVDMIERVLSNLLENAIRYSPNASSVEIIGIRKDNAVSIEVVDHGVGISEEDIPFIFDRFYRVDKQRSITTGGSGLGLAIVKKILEAHKSEISVKSSIGKGCSFLFSLPSA